MRYLTVLCAVVLLIAGCGSGHSSKHQTARETPRAASAQAAMGSVAPPNWGAPVWGPNPGGATFQAHIAAVAMFDTITLSTVPPGSQYLAGYTDGRWPTFLPLTRLSWRPHVKSINVFGSDHADCADVEPGDLTPSQAPGWWRADRAAGWAKPCLYSSLWEFENQVIPAMSRAGIPRSAYWAWDADFTFRAHIDPTFDCTQWTDRAFGRNLDESACSPAFANATRAPAPKPAPKPQPAPWSSAEVQIQGARPNATVTVRVKNGHWTVTGGRVHSLPYNAAPLGK